MSRPVEDADLHRVVVDPVLAARVAGVAADVFEVRRDVPAVDAGVVGHDHGAVGQLRLQLTEVVEIVFLDRVDEHEVVAARQQRQRAERVAHDDLHLPAHARLLGIRLDESREVGVGLDAREPAARRQRTRDEDRRVPQQRADLDRARRPVAVDQAADDVALGAADHRDVPQGGRAIEQREHPPGSLAKHARR